MYLEELEAQTKKIEEQRRAKFNELSGVDDVFVRGDLQDYGDELGTVEGSYAHQGTSNKVETKKKKKKRSKTKN